MPKSLFVSFFTRPYLSYMRARSIQLLASATPAGAVEDVSVDALRDRANISSLTSHEDHVPSCEEME